MCTQVLQTGSATLFHPEERRHGGSTWVLISEEPAWSMASTTIDQAPHPSIPGASSHFQVAEGPRTLESHAGLYSETHGYVKVYLRARAVQGRGKLLNNAKL